MSDRQQGNLDSSPHRDQAVAMVGDPLLHLDLAVVAAEDLYGHKSCYIDLAAPVYNLEVALPLAVPALNAPVLEVDGLLLVVMFKIEDKFVLVVVMKAELLVLEL
jgi:hypothetical protein